MSKTSTWTRVLLHCDSDGCDNCFLGHPHETYLEVLIESVKAGWSRKFLAKCAERNYCSNCTGCSDPGAQPTRKVAHSTIPRMR